MQIELELVVDVSCEQVIYMLPTTLPANHFHLGCL